MEPQTIQVTDSLGTFIVSDPQTIPAEIKKRKLAAENAEREHFEKYETARAVAMVRGFRVLTILREPMRNRRNTAELLAVGSAGCPVVQVATIDGAFSSYDIPTADGSAVVSFHCMETIVSALVDFNGFPWLLFTLDHFSDSETLRAYTIGVFGSVHCLQLIPNVVPSDFEEPQT